MSTPDRQTVLFVLGSARGGTTYLTEFLDDWFDYGMGPEGTFIRPLFERKARYGDLAEADNRRRLARDISKSEMMRILREDWPEDERIDVTPTAILQQVTEPTFAGVVRAALSAVAALRGKHRVGSKDPSFWTYWPVLHELFGDSARYVCIVRDGRDVALSLSQRPWGEKSAYLAAKRWVGYLDALEAMREVIGPDRLHVIRYEDFMADGTASVAFLERATGVALPDEQRARAIEAIDGNSYGKRLYRWKTEMAARDAAIFEGLAERWLSHFGYELSGRASSLSKPELIGVHAQDLQRKVSLTLSRMRRR